MTIRQFASKARDPFLKTVLDNLVHFGGLDVPMLTILLPLAYAHRGMAGFPRLGWLSFARAIEKRFLDLGGEIRYGSRVERLLVEQGSVTGVTLSDGSRLPANLVLSAADGQFTRFELLGKHEGESPALFPPERLSDQPAQVNLGVAEGHEHEDGPVTYILEPPVSAAGRLHDRITVHANYYDDSAAPPGKTAVTVFLDSDYGWWKSVSADAARYRSEKERAAEAVIEAVGRYRPGFRSRVEVVDVSTPLTRERYTGNRMGAMQAMRPASSMVRALTNGGPRYDYPGIRGFFMTGQWVESWGGVTTAAQSARKAVAAICRASGRKFAARID
jgi:phytoene dehydrogenase-like protein